MTNPEVLRLARELMALSYKTPEKRRRALSGIYDHEPEVRLAIAAIERTTIDASVWLTGQAALAEEKCIVAKSPDSRRNYAAGAITVRTAASEIASFAHLRQSEKDNSDAS